MANQTGYTPRLKFDHILEGTDFCPHVCAEDTSKGVGYFFERDSFGYVFTEIVCEECRVAQQKQIDESPCTCDDCKRSFPSKEVWAYKWYDFYAPQGDEPIMVCTECRGAQKHLDRLESDRRNREDDERRDEDEAGDDDLDEDWFDEEERARQEAIDDEELERSLREE